MDRRLSRRDHAGPANHERAILSHVHALRFYRGISTALCVAGFGCAVIECVATRTDPKRQGAARTVLTAVLSWAARQDANLVGLQIAADNTPAVRSNEQLGFIAGATNRFWTKPI